VGEERRVHLLIKYPQNMRDWNAANHEDVRRLVMTYGWNTTAYQTLNPGFEYWFGQRAPAVVAYMRRRNVLVVAGAPVCPPEALAEVSAEFERFASADGCRVCYVCAADRLRETVSGSRKHSMIVIGAQPVWNPQEWPQLATGCRTIRQQVARARNKGVTVETIADECQRAGPELERVLNEWLDARALPPLHFLVEPYIAHRVHTDRLTMVARQDGKAVAFLVASPVAARNGFLIEQVARSSRAPNGSSELLIDAAMHRLANEGRAYATLGLVALSTRAAGIKTMNPWWLRSMMTLARAHANRFYNFRGLERFRLKLAPARWETIFAIANEPRFSIRTLYAIGEAFAGIPPWRAIGLGVVRAIGQEAQRLRHRLAAAS
jgi:phosphatidylglycerol lysyltransferase